MVHPTETKEIVTWASFGIAINLYEESSQQIVATYSSAEVDTVKYTSGVLAITLLVGSLLYDILSRRRQQRGVSTSSSKSYSNSSTSNALITSGKSNTGRGRSSSRNNQNNNNIASANSVDTMLDEKIKKYNDDNNSTRYTTPTIEQSSSPTTDYAMM